MKFGDYLVVAAISAIFVLWIISLVGCGGAEATGTLQDASCAPAMSEPGSGLSALPQPQAEAFEQAVVTWCQDGTEWRCFDRWFTRFHLCSDGTLAYTIQNESGVEQVGFWKGGEIE